jgi:hypothetical protein
MCATSIRDSREEGKRAVLGFRKKFQTVLPAGESFGRGTDQVNGIEEPRQEHTTSGSPKQAHSYRKGRGGMNE